MVMGRKLNLEEEKIVQYPFGDKIYLITEDQLKLLDIYVDPEYFNKPVVVQCKMAGITTMKYYEALTNPDFTSLVTAISASIVKSKTPQVVESAFQYAQTARGGADRKLLLTIAGLYKGTGTQEDDVLDPEANKVTVNIVRAPNRQSRAISVTVNEDLQQPQTEE
jgi:hypothetical protein